MLDPGIPATIITMELSTEEKYSEAQVLGAPSGSIKFPLGQRKVQPNAEVKEHMWMTYRQFNSCLGVRGTFSRQLNRLVRATSRCARIAAWTAQLYSSDAGGRDWEYLMMTSEETTFVGGCKADHLYPRDFKNGAGRFFNYVVEDNATTVEYSPPFPSKNRIKLTLTFIRGSNEITAVTLKRFKYYKKDGWVEDRFMSNEPFQLSHFSFEKLAALLQLLADLDLASLNQPRIPLVEGSISGIDPAFAKKVKSLLIQPDGVRIVEELVRSGLITSHDIVNIGFRKTQLEQFRRMIDTPEEVRAYAERKGVRGDQPEKVWQHFLRQNEWIFGFGLDYRFLGILQDEALVGAPDVAGRDAPISDFLLGASHFTVLVEVKQPGTPLFGGTRARSGAWRLSTDLMESVSQVLQQKADWQVKAEANALRNYDREGVLIRQRTNDPKCILVIGSDGAFVGTDAARETKRRTFELFRRDSRNVDILTYSELYERASFVVGRSARL